MNATAANTSLVEGVKAHVRKVRDALAVCNIEPRFDVSYEGFGMGSFPNVTAEAALRYLTDLAACDDPHYRYRARIKSITVSVRIRDKVFSA